MRVVFVVFALTLVSASAKGESPHPRIVIAPLASSAALESTRDAIASEVRTSVEHAGKCLPRRQSRHGSHHGRREPERRSCPQERCALRLARLVEADLVLTGEITERDGVVNVALRIYDVRDGAITHRLAFDVSAKREDLTREVDNGVRSMLGLGHPQQIAERH